MKAQRIESAGLVYFYLCGYKLENGEIDIDGIDTYRYLPEGFYELVHEIVLQYSDVKDHVNIFGVIGKQEKVKELRKAICDCIYDNYVSGVLPKNIRKECPTLDDMGNTFNCMIQEFFFEYPVAFPNHRKVEHNGMELFYIFDGEPEDLASEELSDSAVESWICKELPVLLGKQSMIRSFYMQNFVGRKLISAIPLGNSDSWTLLFEGGRSLPVDSKHIYNGTITDINELGMFTAAGVESVCLNPVFAFGKLYEPIDICVEWHKVFLYACALARDKWSIASVKREYDRFLSFLEDNICKTCDTCDNETIISEHTHYALLLETINRFQDFLAGEDEPSVSKELLQVLNTRYVYLSYIFRLLSFRKPTVCAFSQEQMHTMIDKALSAKNSFDKGRLWEDAVGYYLEHLEGLKITAKRIRAGHQEIDISVINISQDDILWRMGAYLLVECKNHNKPVGVRDVRNIAYICNMKGCKTAMLFVTNGITKDASEEIYRLSGTGMYILCVTKDELLGLRENEDCMNLLVDKFFCAYK